MTLADGTAYEGQTVILTTGTYLKAEVMVGDQKTPSGPDQESHHCIYLIN